jgi:disulfide oxidoreductase YuzD
MRVFYETHPFAPLSGKIIETETGRIERYYREKDFKGQYFDIEWVINEKNEDVSFNISRIKPAEDEGSGD